MILGTALILAALSLFLWNRTTKKDPWGELYRITKFAQKWKEGDSI